jgi:hypothetical protein
MSAGTRNLRDGRTGLTGPAAAAKEEGGHAHESYRTRFALRSTDGWNRSFRREADSVGGGCLAAVVASWREFSEQAPEIAARVFDRFEAHRHKTMATIRADGGPRISGTEVPIKLGEVWLGGMTGNQRFADLRRDSRVAIHSASEDPDVWTGDAKLAGRAVEVTGDAGKAAFRGSAEEVPPGDFELFRVDLTQAVVVRLSDERDHLLIDVWREGEPVRTHVRR